MSKIGKIDDAYIDGIVIATKKYGVTWSDDVRRDALLHVFKVCVEPMLAEAYTCGLDDEYAKANGIKIDHSPDGADAYAARIIANLTSTTREDDNG